MPSESNTIKVEGIIEEALPGLTFRVRLKENNREILAYLGGRLKLHHIKVIPGDHVVVDITSYDDNRGRITRRL
ncbi:MAG: translation initiation factor IF-1 [bacterium]|nr:translation initiation factor IF-1 [bacterium]